jgi:hypothetical protein
MPILEERMVTYMNGFKLEVTIANELPNVRISLRDGTVVVDTDRVSVVGLQNLSEVFETASSMALQQLEHRRVS